MTFVERLMPATLTRGTSRRDELAFLPAALEIVETPPSPVGRAISVTIIAVFCIAFIWLSVGRVDIIATSTGKIIPTGRTKVIQPFETAVVRAIHVRDGQHVKAGDVLVELDPTISAAELGHLEGDLLATEIEIGRLRAALADRDDPIQKFVSPAGATPGQIATAHRFLTTQLAEQNAKIAAIEWQSAQKKAERTTAEATIEKIEALIPLLQQRVDVRKYLVEKEFGSKLQYLSDMQELVTQQKELVVQKSRYTEVDAALAGLDETRLRTEAEYNRILLDDLAKAEQKAAGLRQDVIKAEERTSLLRLTAQEDGVVQQLAVHSVGGVVTPAQTLMMLVPSTSRLEIEAMVPNRDIGFVRPGQRAAIKLDTFSFTRYGLRHGEVLSVSQDAITRDKPADKNGDKGASTETSSSEPKGQELVYSARISLDRTQMQVDDKLVNLAPGMAVTVEIKTGSRRIIDYLLSPLLRYSEESLRER
jgi:membrane fusion protein, hemolysin D